MAPPEDSHWKERQNWHSEEEDGQEKTWWEHCHWEEEEDGQEKSNKDGNRREDTGHRGKIGSGQKNVGWENWHWEEKTGWWWEEEKTWDHAKEESETEEETSGRCPRDPYYNRNSRKAYVGALIGVLGDSKKGINRGPMKP